MSNKNKKKKKQSAAARQQAAVAYMSRSTTSVQRSPQKKAEEEPTPAPEQAKPLEAEPQTEKKPADTPKKEPASKPKKNKPKFKADKARRKKERRAKIRAFGITKIVAVVLAACALLAGVSVFAWWLSARFVVPESATPVYLGQNLPNSDSLPVVEDSATQAEFAEKMPRKGDTELFEYYAATSLGLAEPSSAGMLNLTNAFNNGCVFIASIVDEAGNICYQSLGLPAGRCLNEVYINNKPYGHYDMHLVVAAYDPDSRELLGVQYSELSVQIGFEEETADVTEK